ACGRRLEELLPMSGADRTTIACPCGNMAERMVSRVAMRPDSAWHFGQFIHGHGYLNSASKIARAQKANGVVERCGRADVEGMKKTAAEAQEAKDRRLERGTKEVFEKTFANSGIVDSFGQLTPDATKKISDEPILRGDDPRIP